jgi:hypothetical protein
MQVDYSDLYDIAAFFIGSPEGRVKGRDDLAQQIAEQGRKFAMEHWRWEDMQAYVSSPLLLEPLSKRRGSCWCGILADLPTLVGVHPADGRRPRCMELWGRNHR